MPTKLVMLSWNDDSPLAPGNALPTPPAYPSNGLPGAPVYPSQGLPGGGYPSQGLPPFAVNLPVYPFDPTLPPTGPDAPPVATHPIAPGGRYIVKWLACAGLILVPDNSLPPTPEPK